MLLRGHLAASSPFHAYLFLGPEGVGKMTTALAFASAINCPDKGCGRCPCCVKIASALHPDVMVISAEGNFITIDQVREVRRDAAIKPFEAKYKVYIFEEVERMTKEAANALLKTLEEPPASVIFILTAANLDGVLDTISSRTSQILFRRLKEEVMVEAMVKMGAADAKLAPLLARLSQGVFGRALKMAKNDFELKRRERIISLIKDLDGLDELSLADFAEELIESIKESLKEIETAQKSELDEIKDAAFSPAQAASITKRLKVKQKRDLNKRESELFEGIFLTFSSWYRDLMAILSGAADDTLINIDLKGDLKRLSQGFSILAAYERLVFVIQTRHIFGQNVNKRLALEVMLFNLKGGI